MSDVFVSYKAEDRRRVKPLVDALEAEGFCVWWDEQIGGGATWRHAIEAELNSAKCVIVAWSKRSVGEEGTFVQDEATRAQQRRVYVPVLIDKVHLPLGFGETQALPLVAWKGDRTDARYRAVLQAVQRMTGAPAKDEPAAKPDRNVRLDRRAVLAGGGAAAIAVAGAGSWALLKPASADAAVDSIAVLPFANLSGDPGQSYFSDGIAEELRNALARLAGLKVVGRTSSEAVRNDDAETAAKKLGVATILTGSVRQSPSTIRVSAQLVDGTNGIEKWSNNYDRPPGDSIKIQSDIAENVANSLRAALGTAAREAISIGGTNDAAAQNLVLKAQEAIHTGQRDDLKRALQLIDQALAIDPAYADAHAQKSLATTWYANTFSEDVPELFELRSQALQSANAALELAPKLGTAHHALGEIHRVTLNLPPALRDYHRALQLAPGDSATLLDYAFLMNRLGRADESIALSENGIAIDPLNPNSYVTNIACLTGARRFAEAVKVSQDLERSRPQLFTSPELVGSPLVALGRFQEAQRYFERAPTYSYNRLVGEATILARTGRKTEAARKIDVIRQYYGDAASYQYAEIYAQLGDKDSAFKALGRAWEIRDSGLLNLKVDFHVDPLRSDSRFATLMAKLNFPS